MTTQVARSQASTTLPGMQSSATVLEFLCLYTPDIRKKQKKWFDGRLKYHTFNKKVMVYDERANFVGDTHWREDYDLEEGEEFQTERSNHLVQVAECVGRREQDLTELLDKRLKEKEERRDARAQLSSPLHTPVIPRPMREIPVQDTSQLPPRSLSMLLGTPTGHYGRAAVSMASPFEERQRARQIATPATVERPSKRRKPDEPPSKSGYAQNLTGATLTLSRPSSSISSSWLRTKTSQKATVDLTDNDASSGVEVNRPAEGSRLQVPRIERMDRPSKRARLEKPERSTYAGNLTGAALVFSKQPSSRTTSEALKASRQIHREPVKPINSSDEEVLEAGEGFIDVDLFSTQPIPLAKQHRQKSRDDVAKQNLLSPPTLEVTDVSEPVRKRRTQAEKSAVASPILIEDGEHQAHQQDARTNSLSHRLTSGVEDLAIVQNPSKLEHRKSHHTQAGIAEKEPDHTKQKPRAKRKKEVEAISESSKTENIKQTPVPNSHHATDSERKQAFSTLRIKARPMRNKLMLMSTPLRQSPTTATQDNKDEDDVTRNPADEHEVEAIDYRTVDRLLTRSISGKSNGEDAEMMNADEEATEAVIPMDVGRVDCELPALKRPSSRNLTEEAIQAARSRTSLSRVDFIPVQQKGSLPKSPTTQTAQASTVKNDVSKATAVSVEKRGPSPRTSSLANGSYGSVSCDECPIEKGIPVGMGNRPGAPKAQVHLANNTIERQNMIVAENLTESGTSTPHLRSVNDNNRSHHLNAASRLPLGSDDNQRSNHNDEPINAQAAEPRPKQLRINQAEEASNKTTTQRLPSIFNLFNGDQDPDTLDMPKVEIKEPESSLLTEVPSNIKSSSDNMQIKVLGTQHSLDLMAFNSGNGCTSDLGTRSTLDPVATTTSISSIIHTSKAESTSPIEPQAYKGPVPDVNKPPIRIVNPATRGRKAALRSDAAGKAPESIVGPANTMLPPPVPRRPTVNAPDRPREPVFRPVSDYVADKGAWTIEAFDMFDWYPLPHNGREAGSVVSK